MRVERGSSFASLKDINRDSLNFKVTETRRTSKTDVIQNENANILLPEVKNSLQRGGGVAFTEDKEVQPLAIDTVLGLAVNDEDEEENDNNNQNQNQTEKEKEREKEKKIINFKKC